MLEAPDLFSNSLNYFEALFNNTKENNVLLMDAEGIILKVNAAFTNAFGYANDIIGSHFKLLFTVEDQKKGMPENEISTVRQSGQSSDNNYLLHKDKNKTWVSGESILVKNTNGEIRILKVIQNIHKQKTYEKSLESSNGFNERILASIDDAVIVVNENIEIVKANLAFNKLFSRDEIAEGSLKLSQLINLLEIDDELIRRIQETIKTGSGFVKKEVEINTPSGDRRMFDISCRAIEAINKENNLLIVLHDKTLEHQLEKQREDIIGFVAHELRNPLSNIVLCNELLSETLKEKKLSESLGFLERSQNNVLRLTKMISELYDATKVGSGNIQLEPGIFNFEEMVKEAVETIEGVQPLYKIRIKGHADIKVHGDRYRLIQVITNYLSNGIKYSEGSDEVELTLKHDDKTVTVSVKDKGLGISKEQLPFIFNRFFRAEKTKNLEGIGLGLYLCRQIITAHGGDVWVDSEEGKGSVFYFTIPL